MIGDPAGDVVASPLLNVRFPPPLAPSSVLAVVAPSSPFERDELFRGLAWLRTRYRIRVRGPVFARDGYLAGGDAERAADVARAFVDPDVSAIVCARGGYGAMRILADLPWEALARAPKWIVGFSDVTALHVAAARHGVASIHGPNVTGLGRSVSVAERAALLDVLERPCEGRAWSDLRVVRPGRAEGPAFGGNLALVAAMAALGPDIVPQGAVLFLEDVTESPYRVDRMLTALRLGGHLARVGAIVLGGFTRCAPGPDGVRVEAVLEERTRSLGVPVLADAPFGHGAPNLAFVLGQRALVEGRSVRFRAR